MFWLIILILILILILIYSKRISHENLFVREGYYPWIGHLFSLINHRNQFVRQCSTKYGDTFKLKLFSQTIIFILNPSDWINIIRNSSLEFLGQTFSSQIFDMNHNFFGKSSYDLKLQNFFNEYLKNSTQLDQLNIRLAKELYFFLQNQLKQSSRKINLFDFIWKFLFHSITKTFFGSIELNQIQDKYRLFDLNIQYLFLLFPKFIYRICFSKVLNAREYLNDFWLKSLHKNDESDLIKSRTDLILENSHWFSLKDYSGEKTFFLWSSLSNTIPTLFWSLIHILHDQNIYKLLMEKLNEYPLLTFDENHQMILNEINLKKLISIDYLESIINETLRLYSNPMIMRKAKENLKISLKNDEDLLIEKDDIIALYPHIAQNHQDYFSNPKQFLFDRFLNRTNENIHGFLPFGTGKSMCPGRLFAKNAIKLSLIFLLFFIQFHFDDFQIIPNENPKRQGIGVSHPINDLQVSIKFKNL